jgi:prepilin-type N-terminal cleavage/methylation domain-containing protein
VTNRSNSARQGAFTLIEILAVVVILGLMASLLLPAIGAGGGRSLRKQGDRVAATLELARQRAVVTGKPHRVVLDLARGAFGVEWLVSENVAYDDVDADFDPSREGTELDLLAPPVEDVRNYYPIPNRFGSMDTLDRGYFFEGVDTPEGWIEQGEVYVVFAWDGSSDAAQIVISDPDNRSIDLDVAPLLEVVRIREEVD